MAGLDPTLISGIATAAATIGAAVLLRVGRKSGNRQEDDEDATEGVSLTKQLMETQRRDFRERIRDLEQETRDQRAEIDRLHTRIHELGGSFELD